MDTQTVDSETGQPVAGQDSGIIAHVENIAASILHDADKDVISALGHVHNLLSSMTTDVTDARKSVEAAIVAFAKHLG